MRKLIMTCLLTTVFLNAVNTHVSSAHATPTDSLAVELDNYLREQTTKGFSGQVLVVHKGQVILDKTYGLPAQSDPHIAFWLASNSKAFTATAILKLQEQGKLSVHDPITRFFKKVPIDKQKITVHQLLTHTSGLPQSYAADGISNRDEAVRAILKLPLETPVGESWTYSNDGYNLLAAIVKVASKKKFEDYLRTNILRPAGLKDTGFWGYQGKTSLASPANPTEVQKQRPTIFRNGESVSNWGYRGATGMFSTTVDIYHWILALRNGSVLKKESLEQLWAFQALIRHVSETTDLYYGYGWNVIAKNNKRVFVKHTGSEDWLGHNGVMCVYENLDIYIVLSNAGEREERGWSTIVSNYLQEKLQT